MLRIGGFFSTENCVKAKLKKFKIIIEKHIIVCLTDEFGRIMSCESRSRNCALWQRVQQIILDFADKSPKRNIAILLYL